MEKLVLSGKGQLTLPRYILDIHKWGKGTEFTLFDTGNEIVIKPVSENSCSQLESPDMPSVYKGKPLTLEDMDRAILTEAGKRK